MPYSSAGHAAPQPRVRARRASDYLAGRGAGVVYSALMVRHRPAHLRMIPPGWTEHDGEGCPLPLEATPMVIFRNGGRARLNVGKSQTYALDPWIWCDPPSGLDIIAFLHDETRPNRCE